jgi:hypothetical protein
MAMQKPRRIPSLTAVAEVQKVATPVPELHPQWQSLDLAALLSEPTAFLSISQNNSLYSPKGVQSREKQWERPSVYLPEFNLTWDYNGRNAIQGEFRFKT